MEEAMIRSANRRGIDDIQLTGKMKGLARLHEKQHTSLQ
jgi:hypothetical protein